MVQGKHRITDDAAADAGSAAEPVGRVEFDSRGNSVWRWAREVLDSTSILLKRLENTDLALEPTQRVPIARVAPSAKPARPQREKLSSGDLSLAEPSGRNTAAGFDPYNSRR